MITVEYLKKIDASVYELKATIYGKWMDETDKEKKDLLCDVYYDVIHITDTWCLDLLQLLVDLYESYDSTKQAIIDAYCNDIEYLNSVRYGV